MKIDKALKKERRNKNLLFRVMILLFIILPLTTYLSGIKTLFVWSYLGIIECLIILIILILLNHHSLKFIFNNNRLRIKSGLFAKESFILCDKVAVVHTSKEKDELEIIIVTVVNFKNKGLKPITQGFIKKYPEAAEEYIKVKKTIPEHVFYFQVVRRGALSKYELLDAIYKNCVRATYTSSAIENIKIARGQIEV
ncbi:MAG: hypothetical protein RR894_07885 [Terrisporobacter sp.]